MVMMADSHSATMHRHQSSLEHVLDFSRVASVFENDEQRQHAEALLALLLNRLDGEEGLSTPFLRVEMVRLIMQIDMAADSDSIDVAPLAAKVIDFTDYLIANFFLPLKASSAKTPQPTPANLSVPSLSSEKILPGSAARVATLRRDCLIRDKHRCVITRMFDEGEAVERIKMHGNSAADDEGGAFGGVASLQVAHILPHSLMSLEGDSEIQTARRNALAVLDMFDVGVRHLIEGTNIDRPTNAITLSADYHSRFGLFRTFFEATDVPHTYRISSLLPDVVRYPPQPLTRTLFLSENSTIDPPLPRLFAVHAAVSRILHMTGAGYYCDKILRDTEELAIKADGSTNLAALTALRLGGWWNGVVA
ncbi:hypothetical protein SPI_04303 [Niveomyces insectorum RCEF 264]|uniref:HNH nuclease domain-containing protein n=1 Tax=Niveomyces insectorum RCEF 264 TaxID=1081102 RepID=A0A167VLN2_9HYPO|nr:hypothetical protein SPI_04303 [Niveomyces insectorum RCEF 264]